MDIEKLATSAVNTYISKTDLLSPFISEGDKEPSWDGHIYIYNHKLKKKKDCIGRVPVQVKGELIKTRNSKKYCKHRVLKEDLNNYLTRGVAFFVVLIDEDKDTLIFYKLLHPVDVKRELTKIGSKKGTNMEFKKAPPYREMTSILGTFCNDCDKQTSFVKNPAFQLKSLEQLSEQIFTTNFACEGDNILSVFDFLLNNEIFLYAKSPIEGYPDMPIDKVLCQQIGQTVNSSVAIDDIEYYPLYTTQKTKNKLNIFIGKSLTLELNTLTKSKANFNIKGTVKEQINDLKFLVSASKHGKIKLGDVNLKFDTSTFNPPFNINELENEIEYLSNIQKILNALDIQQDLIIDHDNFDSISESALKILIQVIVYKMPYNNKQWRNIQRVNMKIFNLHLLLIFVKGLDGNPDTFINELTQNPGVTIQYKGGVPIPAPQYILLGKSDYQNISSIYYNRIFHSLTNYGTAEPLLIKINYSLLAMLSAYDIILNKELLDTCLSLSKWLLTDGEHLPMEVRQINYLQTIKRSREFVHDELLILYDIVKSTEDDMTLTSVFALLNHTEKTTSHYKKIKSKKDFIDFPIYKFVKPLINDNKQ